MKQYRCGLDSGLISCEEVNNIIEPLRIHIVDGIVMNCAEYDYIYRQQSPDKTESNDS